jgi:hypothetical protein
MLVSHVFFDVSTPVRGAWQVVGLIWLLLVVGTEWETRGGPRGGKQRC